VDQPIQVFDWARIFFGDEPPLFFLEIAFRTLVIYVYTLGLLRWLGSRAIGQLSTVEFLLVIALGSAVGDAMFYPDVPLLHALAVITIVVLVNKALDILIRRSEVSERVIDGTPSEAIRNGFIPKDFAVGGPLSQGELFQQLREKGIGHLGQVAHAYVETDGVLTVFKAADEKTGLPIVPPWELDPPKEVKHGGSKSTIACRRCGWLEEGSTTPDHCPNCDHEIWVEAHVPRHIDLDR